MKFIWTHFRWITLELLRKPSYVVSTIAFPSLFYVIFAVPESKTIEGSNLLLASFSCFSVFGIFFLQFGVGIAQERSKSWYYYLRTLPMKSYQLMIARFISAYFFALLAVSGIIILAFLLTEISLDFKRWVLFLVYLFIAGNVFCLMGLCLGYWANEKSSLPIGNLIYLPLSFVGGLWKPPEILPEILKDISKYLPTRQYGEILWKTVAGENLDIHSVNILLAYALSFIIILSIGMQRDFKMRIT